MANNCTFIHGNASNQQVDTAGEIVDLAGLDCGSLINSAFNWEHQNSQPNQIVGKILEYKKIFSEADCENEHHKYFWDKCKTPYLYVMGRLFDDKKDSSKEVAALFRDDEEHPDEHPMVGFSVEGSRINKTGIIVDKSIARRITITHTPANKACIAKIIISSEGKQIEDNEDSIFKSEPSHTIELMEKSELKKAITGHEKGIHLEYSKGKSIMGSHVREPSSHGVGSKEMARRHSKVVLKEMKQMPKPNLPKSEDMNKTQVPGSKYPPAAEVKDKPKTSSGGIPKFGPIPTKPKPESKQIGTTKSGKPVLSHAKPFEYKGFSAQDHQDAANLHMGHAEEGKGIPGASHFDTAKKHMALAGRGEKQAAASKANRQEALKRPDLNVTKMTRSEPNMKKALAAGSGMAAPGNLVQGAALAPESIDKKMKKAQWLARAEQAYKSWQKREMFESFMAKHMPSLTKGEIVALGQVLALRKSLRAEDKLKKMMRDEGQDSWVKKKE